MYSWWFQLPQGYPNIHLVKGIGKVNVDYIYWLALIGLNNYHQTSNIKRTLVGNKIVDHSQLNTRLQWICQRQLQDETTIIQVLWFGAADIRYFTVLDTCLVPTEFLPLHYYLSYTISTWHISIKVGNICVKEMCSSIIEDYYMHTFLNFHVLLILFVLTSVKYLS